MCKVGARFWPSLAQIKLNNVIHDSKVSFKNIVLKGWRNLVLFLCLSFYSSVNALENQEGAQIMKYEIYLNNKPIEEATPEEKRALYVKMALAFYRLAGKDTEEIFKVFGEKYRKLDDAPRQNENKNLE